MAALATWWVLGAGLETACAQFTTIINSPPTNFLSNASIGSHTQLNILPTGSTGFDFTAGAADASSTEIEVNLQGGRLEYGFKANGGTVVNVTSGRIEENFSAGSGTALNISGGIVADSFFMDSGATLSLTGNEFRLDGVLVTGLESIGDSTNVDLSSGAILSGTLSDGTPFAFSNFDADNISSPVVLHAATLPAIGPAAIGVDTGEGPGSIRAGQNLTLGNDGSLPSDFQAGRGSTVTINGGFVGRNLEATGATVNINGGFVDSLLDAFGSAVNITGGEVSYALHAFQDSHVNISGGALRGSMEAHSGSHFRVSGGVFGDQFIAHNGSHVTIVGGEFRLNGELVPGLNSSGDFVPLALPPGFDATITGTLSDGTPFVFSGNDGDLLIGSVTLERSVVPPVGPALIQVPVVVAPKGIRAGQTLRVDDGGTVPDNFNAGRGSTVFISGGNVGNNFEAVHAQVVITGGTINSAFDAFDGAFVRMTGGDLGTSFSVGDGSVAIIEGGSVGSMSVFTGGRSHISGGTIGNDFRALDGSSVTISGGTLGDRAIITHGGEATVTGGQIGNDLWVYGNLSVSGGKIGNWMITIDDGVFNFAGGELGERFIANDGSVVNISGGIIGDHFAANGNSVSNLGGSTINLFGTHFVLNGVDITATLTPNVPLEISARNVPLTGVLADGSPFDFYLDPSNWIEDEFSATANLIVTLVDFQPGDFNRDGFVDAADYTVWRNASGSTVSVGTGADGNFDGRVSQGDFDVWKRHFGHAGSGSAETAGTRAVVPESGALTLAVLAIAILLLSIRQNWLPARR